MTPLGLHLIADLLECDLSRFARTEQELAPLKSFISASLTEAGLQELGSHYHFFGPGAVTAVVCLAESHLSFHSWPEFGRVNLDIFVCNMSGDFGDRARCLLERLADSLFHPRLVRKSELCR